MGRLFLREFPRRRAVFVFLGRIKPCHIERRGLVERMVAQTMVSIVVGVKYMLSSTNMTMTRGEGELLNVDMMGPGVSYELTI